MEKKLKIRKNSTVENGCIRLNSKTIKKMGIHTGGSVEVSNSHGSRTMKIEELDWMSEKEIELNEDEIKNFQTKPKEFLMIRTP
ncbi:MAG: hypothetical protein PVG65_07270 [Candidatus Thorarchaeota archaeon]